ncbi:MAG: phosphoribosylglycinamide formyltransferase [Spirochaetes bacterium]|nr:phosphoribosylglycinamide formyltransferase [Spirochaetota bacterium]
MANIAVMASGNGTNFQALAEHFQNKSNHSLAILICNRQKAFALTRAKKLEIDTYLVNYLKETPNSVENKIINKLNEYQIDIVFLAGYMKILSDFFIKHVNRPVINIHPSLLPLYKGTHSIERAFHSNDQQSGITIHYVNEELDGGEIIFQKSINIDRSKPLDFFEENIHQLEHQFYPEIAENLCNKIDQHKSQSLLDRTEIRK